MAYKKFDLNCDIRSNLNSTSILILNVTEHYSVKIWDHYL